ncbi:hypothetical protein F4805DRAFT_171843 [Annulohypoxylon moriforme]|nr:hypothetical protein F4805DRAFT_171843 [Annulohypoxylon moriforme]
MTLFQVVNSHQACIVVIPVIMVVLATIAVAMRFRARRLQGVACMFDDWLALVALILTWAFQGVNLAAVFAGGAGLPVETVMSIDPEAVVTFLKIELANFLIWIVVVSVVQLSILAFYVRIFGTNVIFRRACYVVIALVVGEGITGFFPELFSCTPVSKWWDSTKDGTCINGNLYCGIISPIHVALDLAIVILPMPLIWNLQMSIRNKLVLSVLLCLGLVASIISLLKIVCLFDLTGIPNTDVTDYIWLTIVLQTVELPIGIICCCVPSLKPVVIDWAPKFNSLTTRLLSWTRTTQDSASKRSGYGELPRSGNTSSAGFAHLDKSSTQGSLGNKASAHAHDIEMLPPMNVDPVESGKGIGVTNSYVITRQ